LFTIELNRTVIFNYAGNKLEVYQCSYIWSDLEGMTDDQEYKLRLERCDVLKLLHGFLGDGWVKLREKVLFSLFGLPVGCFYSCLEKEIDFYGNYCKIMKKGGFYKRRGDIEEEIEMVQD